MIKQTNRILLKLKETNSLTYDKCHGYITEYISKEDKYFKKSNDLSKIDGYDFLGMYCEIEIDLDIKLWGECLDGLNTVNELSLIVYHELLNRKYENNKDN